MKKSMIIIPAAILGIVALGLILLFTLFPKSDFSAYEKMHSPRITRLPGQKMLEVTVQGAPEETMPAALTVLYQIYYRLPSTPKAGNPPAPRLRCAVSESPDGVSFPADGLTATIGLPLPDAVRSLPAALTGGGLKPAITAWEYGEVAEIVHHGGYDREIPTIRALLDFINAQGYTITGIHEEEYLLGPGAPGVTPEKYLTVIRYPVRKTK